jgi:hypothetical protein
MERRSPVVEMNRALNFRWRGMARHTRERASFVSAIKSSLGAPSRPPSCCCCPTDRRLPQLHPAVDLLRFKRKSRSPQAMRTRFPQMERRSPVVEMNRALNFRWRLLAHQVALPAAAVVRLIADSRNCIPPSICSALFVPARRMKKKRERTPASRQGALELREGVPTNFAVYVLIERIRWSMSVRNRSLRSEPNFKP